MKTLKHIFVASIAVLSLAACGGRPRQQETVVIHQEVAPACAEQWVHMPMLITFPTGGAIIDEQNRIILSEIVRTAQSRTDIRRVRVEGHTDPCGSELNNMALSNERAVSVANELVTMGVPREMLETVGFGSTQLRAGVQGECGQALSDQTNRRVEFTLLVCR